MPSAIPTKRPSHSPSDVPDDSLSGEESNPHPKRARVEQRNGRTNGTAANEINGYHGGDDDDVSDNLDMDGDGEGDGDDESENILPEANVDVEAEEDVLGSDMEVVENTSPYQPGSIKRIRCIDFVTYAEIDTEPGPSLNMVIGPNGTGKSTLVCAMCLGLGWSPSVLGRAKDVGEFVKHGSHESIIEITLQGRDDERDPVIKRRIRKENNKSDWWVNGKPSSEKKVKALAKDYNIQIDNLCQFLPQDKVSEFAKLPEVDKFKETLRAAAPPAVTKMHTQLQELGKKLQDGETVMDTDRMELTRLEAKQKSAEEDVQRLKERQDLINRIELYEKAKPWLQYKIQRAQTRQLKEDYQNAQARLDRLRQESEVALERPKHKHRYMEAVTAASKRKKKEMEDKEKLVKEQKTEVEQLEGVMKKVKADEKVAHEKETTRRREVETLKHKVQNMKRRLENTPPEFDLRGMNNQITELGREKREKMGRIDEINQEASQLKDTHKRYNDQLQAEKERLEKLQSVAGQKQAFLARQSPDTAKAWDFYQKNKNLFEKEIFPPPIICCKVKDERFIDMIETVMPDKYSLLCQTQNDYLLLQAHCFGSEKLHIEGMKLRDVTIKNFSETPVPTLEDQHQLRWSREELRSLGFDGVILDYIDGPKPVLNMLCHGAKFHQWPIGLRDDPQKNIEIQARGITRWSSARSMYDVRTRYGTSSTSVNPARKAKIFCSQGVDMIAKREAERRIAELTYQCDEIKEELLRLKSQHEDARLAVAPLQEEIDNLKKEKERCQKQHSDYNKLVADLPLQEDKLAKKRAGSEEYRETLKRLDVELDEATAGRAQAALAYAQHVIEFASLQSDLVKIELRVIEARSDVALLEHRNQAVMHRISQLDQQVDRLKREYQKAKDEASARYKEMSAAVAAMSPEDREALSSVPVTMSELEEEIEIARTNLGMIHEGNPNAIRHFEERAKKIEIIRKKIENADAQLDKYRNGIKELRSRFEPKVDEIIKKVSKAFSHSFSKINCAGEVKIYKDDDFSKWAIEIWVKFREKERLQILTGQRQSGGERAVSTVFYLMALQSLARSPFRVVDEINQGMDPRNERMVHHRMVNIACQEHTSQYFLITPKLLVNLHYHPRMTILTIMSGDWMGSGIVMDYKRFFASIRQYMAAKKGKAIGKPNGVSKALTNGYPNGNPRSSED